MDERARPESFHIPLNHSRLLLNNSSAVDLYFVCEKVFLIIQVSSDSKISIIRGNPPGFRPSPESRIVREEAGPDLLRRYNFTPTDDSCQRSVKAFECPSGGCFGFIYIPKPRSYHPAAETIQKANSRSVPFGTSFQSFIRPARINKVRKRLRPLFYLLFTASQPCLIPFTCN